MSDSIFQEGGPLETRRTGPNEYELKIRIPVDSHGMAGRECPDPECSPGYFKVKPGTGITGGQTVAFCPYCRHEDEPSAFFTQEQKDYAIGLAKNEALKGIDRIIQEALGLGPSQSKKIGGGLISLELSYTPARPTPVLPPIEEELCRDITCPQCGLKHAVFGLATWCPDCGTDLFLTHVEDELEVARKTLAAVDSRQIELGARVAARDIENALEDVVSIFEAVLKAITRRHLLTQSMPPKEVSEKLEKVVRNSYQNVASAATTFRTVVGMELLEGISKADLTDLSSAFEKRHPITHNLGIIDRKYLEKARSRETEGREIRISAPEVLRTIEIANAVMRGVYERVFKSQSRDDSPDNSAG